MINEMIIKKYKKLTNGVKKPLEIFKTPNSDGNIYGVRIKNHNLDNVYMSDCKYSTLVMGIGSKERALEIIELVKRA